MYFQKEMERNKQIDKLIQFIVEKSKLDIEEVNNLVNSIMSQSFNEKYSTYDYLDDARSLNIDWKNNFLFVYQRLLVSSMQNKDILNVGVGSGNEAIALFSDCPQITFVDIASIGLEKIKKQFQKHIEF